MRTLKRNERPVYYALYTGVQELTDASGNYTGEYAPSYGTPVLKNMNVSAAKGTADVAQFGIDTPYSKTIVTDDMECPIKEDTVLWIEKTPSDGSYNYVVVLVARSINSITYAVREVDVSGTASDTD